MFLDGLDELPLGLQAAALSKINEAGALAEVVLTSRFHAYKQALTGARLWRTAVVEVLPVEARQAGEFLLAEQLGDRRQQWQQVADLLVARPESVTARTLTTPLALSLARDVYAEEPARLVDADGFTSERELQRNLLRQSVLRAFPGPGGETARWWLARLAQRMGDGRSLSWTGIPVLVIRESMDLRLSVVAAVSAICLVTGGLVMSVLNVIVPVNQIVALCLMLTAVS
ncbi:hypothetical protein [Actinoplanes solisilvae]|uniref:hypothetical protein n=1 Tax=Actinoplanes solisilvae TaxID=2486853 RepID=UPI000FDAAE8E|nr:hypothetical protein [Actinoplanes solisilvae]